MSDWWIDESVPPPNFQGIGVLLNGADYLITSKATVRKHEDGFCILDYGGLYRSQNPFEIEYSVDEIGHDESGIMDNIKAHDKMYILDKIRNAIVYIGRVQSFSSTHSNGPGGSGSITYEIKTILTEKEFLKWSQGHSQQLH